MTTIRFEKTVRNVPDSKEKNKEFVLISIQVHCVREQSGFFDLAQTERNMQIKFDLKLSGYSLGVDI